MLTLLLRVKGLSGRVSDVSVELEDSHTVADLAQALAAHLSEKVPAGHVPHAACDRLGLLQPNTTVVAVGLLSGDEVSLSLTMSEGAAARPRSAGGLFLEVISGPSSGTSVPMRAGSYAVGRDPEGPVALADPTVSKHHVTLHVDSSANVTLTPAPNITNEVVVDGVLVEDHTPLSLDSVVQLGSSAFTVRLYRPEVVTVRDQLGQIPFNRTPYRRPEVGEPKVDGPGRLPSRFEKRPFQLIALIMPAMSGLIMWATMPSGGSRYLLVALLTPVMGVATWWDDRRRGGKQHRKEVAEFDERTREWIARYDEALERERVVRYQAAPDLASVVRRARVRSTDLWQRTVASTDFLTVRVGLGDDRAATSTEIPQGDDNSTLNRIEEEQRKRSTLQSVPVSLNLAKHPVTALHGAAAEVDMVAAAIAIQIAGLHSPEDAIVTAALSDGRSMEKWVKWLPHTRSVSSPLSGDHIAVGKDESEDLLRRLLEIGATRGENAPTRVVLFLDERCELDSVLVSMLLDSVEGLKFSVVWVGDSLSMVPRQASAVIECPDPTSGNRGLVWFTDPAIESRRVDLDRMGESNALEFARSLAPVTDTTSASATASIPRIAPLFTSFGVLEATPEWVASNWALNTKYGLRAPIGIGASGQFSIDLVQNGPHGLIAGTSGAGKSELLQSLVASLAAQYPPERLNFLFIDYKGGASSNMFKDIPHTVGYVTNLSPSLSMRALTSLRAELNRRMRVLEGRAKDLEEMLEKFPDECPPSLVIVVDEFATLVKEIPDFVTGMVDIAQRGRSLGIHLILATQRPTGAVNDNILANTNLRISLRVLDGGDSQAIIGTSDAAFLPAPLKGRAFARTGAGQIIEFQSAFAGAPFTIAEGISAITVEDFPAGDIATQWPPRTKDKPDAAGENQLGVLLQSISEATRVLGKERGRAPWLEPLPESISTGSLPESASSKAGFVISAGVLDDPENQRHMLLKIDLGKVGNLLAVGNAGSGRSTLLRTVLWSALDITHRQGLEVYVLDFGGKGLDAIARLKQVRALGNSEDLEISSRIIQKLQLEVAARQDALADAGSDDIETYNTIATNPLSRILVLIDDFGTLLKNFEGGILYSWVETLCSVIATGRSLGVHVVMTSDRLSSLPVSVLNAAPERLMLRMTERESYTEFGISYSAARDIDLRPGECLTASKLFGVISHAGETSSLADQLTALLSKSELSPGEKNPLLGLPLRVHLDDLEDSEIAGALRLGLTDTTNSVCLIEVKRTHVLIVGHPESGRTSTLKTIASEFYRIGERCLVFTDNVDRWSECGYVDVVVEAEAQLREIRRRVELSSAELTPVLVDFENEVPEDLSREIDAQAKARFFPVCVAINYQQALAYPGGIVGTAKKSRLKILLQPDDEGVVSSIGDTRTRWRPQMKFPPGRAVVISGRSTSIVQVALSD